MSAFVKNISLTALGLSFLALIISMAFPSYRIGAALAGMILMALNALLAVGTLYLKLSIEPVRLIMLSMAARLPLVGAIMVASVLILKPETSATYSFLFTAMVAFLAFQATEIFHVIRHPEMMRR